MRESSVHADGYERLWTQRRGHRWGASARHTAARQVARRVIAEAAELEELEVSGHALSRRHRSTLTTDHCLRCPPELGGGSWRLLHRRCLYARTTGADWRCITSAPTCQTATPFKPPGAPLAVPLPEPTLRKPQFREEAKPHPIMGGCCRDRAEGPLIYTLGSMQVREIGLTRAMLTNSKPGFKVTLRHPSHLLLKATVGCTRAGTEEGQPCSQDHERV